MKKETNNDYLLVWVEGKLLNNRHVMKFPYTKEAFKYILHIGKASFEYGLGNYCPFQISKMNIIFVKDGEVISSRRPDMVNFEFDLETGLFYETELNEKWVPMTFEATIENRNKSKDGNKEYWKREYQILKSNNFKIKGE